MTQYDTTITGPDAPVRPLRKIVGTVGREIAPGVRVVYEQLECGHEQREKQDIYGPTNAYRRRCRQCPSIARKKKR
jgi:hypothetical protein